jgi:hypothetical protein
MAEEHFLFISISKVFLTWSNKCQTKKKYSYKCLEEIDRNPMYYIVQKF